MSFPQIKLNKNSPTPLYRQLYEAIKDLKLPPGTKLPSIRQLASSLSVNTTTVVSAYKELEIDQVAYSVMGSGTFIAPTLPATKQVSNEIPVREEGYINFAESTTDKSLFPVMAFRRAFEAVLERDGGSAFGYDDARGFKPLRESFAKIVGEEADNIHVISDTYQCIEAIANDLLSPGDTVLIENYTSQPAIGAFLSKRAQVVEMPIIKDGIDFETIKKYRPKLIYVMPNFQTPTGITYSEESKTKLLTFAQKTGAYIIEEDQYSDLYYDGTKRTPIKAQDNDGRVIYIKSFSKTVMPGIGFVSFPKEQSEIFARMESSVSGYIQRGFDLFLRSGAYELHLANMRTVYGRRYQKLESAAKSYLAHLTDFELPGGGFSMWISPHKKNEAEDFVQGFLQKGVIVSPGRLYTARGGDTPSFRLSFASIPEEKIAEGIGIIASVLSGSE